MIVSPILAVCALGLSAFGGFCFAHKQRDERDAANEQLRKSWAEIQARAIRDGVLDKDGRPVETQE